MVYAGAELASQGDLWDEQNQMLKEADVSSEEETFRMLEQICSSRVYSKAYEIQELYFRQFGERTEELGMQLDISGKLYHGGRCIKDSAKRNWKRI